MRLSGPTIIFGSVVVGAVVVVVPAWSCAATVV
jgi:hypothetical protein